MQCSKKYSWREPFKKLSLQVPLKNKDKNHGTKIFYNLQNNLYAVFQKCLWREPFKKLSLKVPLKNKDKNHGTKIFYNLQNNFVCSVPKNILGENPLKNFLSRFL